jgi:enoyl-CoA hydratase/carnithine racemase
MPVHLRCEGPVAVLTLDRPPVNALSQAMRQALWSALERADADEETRAIVLIGAGRGFCGGGDLAELRSPVQQAWPGISNHLLPRIEACRKPVIAALHGFAVGGGFELALACHHRVATRHTRIALPEMKHGVVPPSGSQRLPRAVGVERSLDLMVTGKTVHAGTFADTVLFARLCDEAQVLGTALEFAGQLGAAAPARSLLRHRPLDKVEARAGLAAWREQLYADPHATRAMHACAQAVGFAVDAPDFDAGLAAAKRLHDQLAGVNLAIPAQAGIPEPAPAKAGASKSYVKALDPRLHGDDGTLGEHP